MKNTSEKLKNIFIRLNQSEYDYIVQQTNDTKLSINKYIKRRIFDSTEGRKELSDSIMRLIPRIYTQIDQIENVTIRHALKEEVSRLCRCLN